MNYRISLSETILFGVDPLVKEANGLVEEGFMQPMQLQRLQHLEIGKNRCDYSQHIVGFLLVDMS